MAVCPAVPVVFSTNLFLWFRDDWFYLQFVMIAVGFAAKELIRWNKDGRRTHIFNPSSFALTIFSVSLLASGACEAYPDFRFVLGESGVLATASMLGLTDMDALTFGMNRLAESPDRIPIAALAITLGVTVNGGFKAVVTAVVGRGRYRTLALIGLFNVFGSYFVGILGQSIPRRFLLVGIYSLRAVAILIFINLPLSIYSVYVFSAVMGLLWLSTVPPTNAIIAQIFGVQHFSMLGGFVFFSHQIGSFLGVWLGGWLYDVYQSYQPMWYIAIALSVFAVCVTYPVKEGPIQRVPQAT